jgi:hypothetical protein
MKLQSQILVLISPLLLSNFSYGAAWDRSNQPSILLGYEYVDSLSALPTQGRLSDDKLPYSDTYWPNNRGGIAYRWNSSDPAFAWSNPKIQADPRILQYQSPSRSEALQMSRAQLAELSPTEKFDLVQGYYYYPLTRGVLSELSVYDSYWEGMCHGWAPAALNHPEPAPVDVTNPDGVVVPFGSADVKALLNYYYGNYNMYASQIGRRCDQDLARNPRAAYRWECEDINAGAFHLAMTNLIGLRNKGFVAEVDRGVEVWNNPAFAYRYSIDETQTTGSIASSARGTVRRVLVRMEMTIADDDENFGPTWDPVVGTPNYRQETIHYQYYLDLGADDSILGGEWVSFERPDFIWIKNEMRFTGDFAALNSIYRPAARR